MPDEKPDETPAAGEPKPADLTKSFADAVSAVADKFAEKLDEVKVPTPTAPVVTAPAGPSVDDLKSRYAEGMTKFQELMEAGEYTKATEYYGALMRDIGTASAGKDEDAPAYQGMFETARRLSRGANEKTFETYGDEIEAEVAAMDAKDRVNPAKWDDAVARVKTRHFDAILDDAIKAREDARDTAGAPGVTPQAPGSRGAADSPQDEELTEEQQDARQLLNMSEEDYKKSIKSAGEHEIKRGFHKGMLHLVTDGTPQPGAF